MLLDPISTRPDSADVIIPPLPDPAVLPALDDVEPAPAPAELPGDLTALVARARRDRGSALALVHLLLERGWTVPAVRTALSGLSGLTGTQIESLATVRRPRTSASDVADRLVARHGGPHVPYPRSH
ncbi:hypothetical protein [Actinomycetospora atypica]|uniref:ANTAR domain-containing protein n=1 Tax=Actinomycetospora atypica TaxID=1290095 RepID=A0ABV9YYY9_9PSEU